MAGLSMAQALQSVEGGMRECIENCLSCHAVCVQTIAYSLSKGGDHADPDHIRALQDCADACIASADFMLRGSPLHAGTCGVCADACVACAESCEQFADDDVMKACADACRACAESCREMAGHHGGH